MGKTQAGAPDGRKPPACRCHAPCDTTITGSGFTGSTGLGGRISARATRNPDPPEPTGGVLLLNKLIGNAAGLVGLCWLLGSACGPAVPPAPDSGAAVAREAAQDDNFRRLREQMVERQLRARDIDEPRVLEAMQRVPRHEFVPDDQRRQAYEDGALPIGFNQTISQPYIVAYMTQALEVQPEHKVLEIGTGSGYQAAVLGEVAGSVHTIEIVPELAERSRRLLERLGYRNVEVRAGDGYRGWPEQAPFDRIMVTAAPPEIPQALVDQLAVGGRMVIPVGTWFQEMTIVTKTETGVTEQRTIPVRFVPMIKGAQTPGSEPGV
jgi:protein-L-isoaspartate(D-aspartate) O-methyltransferase